MRQGTLLAQPFDLDALTVTGEAIPVAEHVEATVVQGIAGFSASDNGILAYGVGTNAVSSGLQLTWVDRQGKETSTAAPAGNYRGIDLSADGNRVAVHRHDGSGGDIWVTDLSRGTTSRFTFDAAQENSGPIWSPDGTRIVYQSYRNGKSGLYQKAANNAGAEERLLESDVTIAPMTWSPDGRSVVYESVDPKTSNDIWLLPTTGDRKPVPLLRTPFSESHPQISPDGRWFVYSSTETGRSEIYVQPFPSGAGKWQVSANGGSFPRWRPDGRELFYMSSASGGNIMAVDVTAHASTFDVGSPRALFDSRYINLTHTGTTSGAGPYHTFAVSADGQRFLIPYPTSNDTAATAMPIAVVENWTRTLMK